MGWNTVMPLVKNKLLKGVTGASRFYFVHSFAVHVKVKKYSLMKTNYGIEFDSAVSNGNIFGVQFHPEKSHSFGMKILKNFAEL